VHVTPSASVRGALTLASDVFHAESFQRAVHFKMPCEEILDRLLCGSYSLRVAYRGVITYLLLLCCHWAVALLHFEGLGVKQCPGGPWEPWQKKCGSHGKQVTMAKRRLGKSHGTHGKLPRTPLEGILQGRTVLVIVIHHDD